MKVKNKLRCALLGEAPNSFYRENRERIARENLHSLRLGLAVGLLMESLLMCGHIIMPAQCPADTLYFWTGILCLACLVPAVMVLPGHTKAVLPVLYGFILLVEISTMAAETFYAPDHPAIASFILLVVLSILVLDKPWHAIVMSITVDAVFAVLIVTQKKDYPDTMCSDLVNAVLALVLTLFFCCYVMNIRLRSLRSEQVLRTRSETDLLTGIANKAAVDKMCREYLSPGQNRSCALIMLDIDNFKSINDTQGHAAGDEVLHSIGLVMRAMFREEDIVGRFGGDEFLVLMKNISDGQKAQQKAECLHSRLADIMVGGVSLSCSMGVAITGEADGAVSYEQLFSHADMALYSSKSGEKNTITLYREKTEET